MKISAKIIRAAMVCQARDDIRYYLNGFKINKKYVQSTNGHVAVQMEHGLKRIKDGIYFIQGKIPAKAELVKFIIRKNLKIVEFIGVCDEVVGVSILEIIEGNFPDIDNKIIKPLKSKKINNKNIPRISTEYLSLTNRMFKFKYLSCDMEFRGEDTAILVKFSGGLINEECGNPELIIMPVVK